MASKLLLRILDFLHPQQLLAAARMDVLWKEQEVRTYKFQSSIFFGVVGASFIAHYYLVDAQVGLQPEWFWFTFRVTIFVSSLAIIAYNYSPLYVLTGGSRAPHLLVILSICTFQAMGFTYDNRVPWYFAAVIPLISILLLRASLAVTLSLLLAVYAVQTSFIVSALGHMDKTVESALISSYFASAVFLIMLKSSDFYRIKLFIDQKKRENLKEEVIIYQKEITDQLSNFLPPVLFDRMRKIRSEQRVSFEYATQEVLKPRTTHAAILWSDIRKFTQNSRDIDLYLKTSALPNIRLLTDIINRNGGVPRLIGDLVLSYFDDNSPIDNLLICISAASKFIVQHTAIQRQARIPVHRNLLVSEGIVLTGNVGTNDCREITVLGPPVNLLARLDELISRGSLNDALPENYLVVVPSADFDLPSRLPECELIEIHLVSKGVHIRDFPEVDSIFALNPFDFIDKNLDSPIGEDYGFHSSPNSRSSA